MIITKKLLSKSVTVGSALVLALAFSSVAHAQTMTTTSAGMPSTTMVSSTAQLQAELAALQARLGTSDTSQTGVTSVMGPQLFTTNLAVGSSGSAVSTLQAWLISKGFHIPAGATGHFGAQTQSALASYQASNGISPAAGYFGPTTRAHVNGSVGGSTTSVMGPMIPGCTIGHMYSTTTGQSCGTTANPSTSASTNTSFSASGSLDSQMSAITGQESGLSSDLSQEGNVSGQDDTGE